MKTNNIVSKTILIILMAVFVLFFIQYDVSNYLTLESIKSNQALVKKPLYLLKRNLLKKIDIEKI